MNEAMESLAIIMHLRFLLTLHAFRLKDEHYALCAMRGSVRLTPNALRLTDHGPENCLCVVFLIEWGHIRWWER